MLIQVRHYLGLSGLIQLKADWLQLFSTCLNPAFYNDWRWHHALQTHLLKKDVFYFAVYENDVPIAIVPLTTVTRHQAGLDIEFLIFPHHVAVDLTDLLLHRDKTHLDLFGLVFKYINQQRLLRWQVCELARFTDTSATRALLDRQGSDQQSSAQQSVPMGSSAYAQRNSTHSLIADLSKKQIKNVQRHQKSAEQEYGSTHFTQALTPDEIARAYETFLDVEQAGWKGVQGTNSAIRLRPDARDFYAEVLKSFAGTGEAVVNLLAIGNQPAAAQMGLRTGERLFLLKIGYDETFRDLGPGGIALLRCLEQEAQRSSAVSLVTDPPWAERWHFLRENTWRNQRFNTSLYGRLLQLAQRCRIALKRFRS